MERGLCRRDEHGDGAGRRGPAQYQRPRQHKWRRKFSPRWRAPWPSSAPTMCLTPVSRWWCLGPEHAATIAADGLQQGSNQSRGSTSTPKSWPGKFSPGNFARHTQRGWPQTEDITPESYVGSHAFSADDILSRGGRPAAGKHSCFHPDLRSHPRPSPGRLPSKDGTPASFFRRGVCRLYYYCKIFIARFIPQPFCRGAIADHGLPGNYLHGRGPSGHQSP